MSRFSAQLIRSLKNIKGEKTSWLLRLYTATTDIKFIDWLSNTYFDILTWFRVQYETIGRFFYWGWKLKKSHDWDAGYLYEIMYLKLDRMVKSFTNHGHCVWNSDYDSVEMRKIRIARECCKRLKEDNFCNELYDKYFEKWGYCDILTELHAVKPRKLTTKQENQKRLEFKEIGILEENRRKQCFKLLTKLIEHNSRSWWD